MRKVEAGHWVRCPENRGQEAHFGKVVSFSGVIQTNYQGIDFVWVTVESHIPYHTHKAIWASHNIGMKLVNGELYHV